MLEDAHTGTLSLTALVLSAVLVLYVGIVMVIRIGSYEHVPGVELVTAVSSCLLTFVCVYGFREGWNFSFVEDRNVQAENVIVFTVFDWSLVVLAILAQFVFVWYTSVQGPHPQKPEDMKNKVCVVTGANSGIGVETARSLAKMGARVIMACRSLDQANKVALDIQTEIDRNGQTNQVEVMQLDLSSFKSVRQFVANLKKNDVNKVDVLINNAGYMNIKRWETADGQETTMQVNYLSVMLLTLLLTPLLRKSTMAQGGRVVNVSSCTHKYEIPRGVRVDDLQLKNEYTITLAYKQSKLANRLFAMEYHRRLRQRGDYSVHIMVANPGLIFTKITRNIPMWMDIGRNAIRPVFKTPSAGAYCSIHCATSKECAGVSAEYFENCHIVDAPLRADYPEQAKMLWEKAEAIIGFKAEEVNV